MPPHECPRTEKAIDAGTRRAVVDAAASGLSRIIVTTSTAATATTVVITLRAIPPPRGQLAHRRATRCRSPAHADTGAGRARIGFAVRTPDASLRQLGFPHPGATPRLDATRRDAKWVDRAGRGS